ncbi:hypothetical protein HPB52_001408 [Rhipicephalus sanguineus]|uniref:Uncharacterized protein n=1 Tax=Rhipicephalus sanguineus TaxID=34632 RepID=A0A9D4PBV4_RHISA|nr:hypothetical protein HPB52_001408 [Rhipicephalus sanguineus]
MNGPKWSTVGLNLHEWQRVLIRCDISQTHWLTWHKKAALGRFTVIGENQQVGVPGLRPDLVLARGEKALILDVCCPFDNRMQAFQEARRVKEEKYAPLQLHLLRRFQRVSVEANVVGCLGSWDPGNDPVCRRLCSRRLCVSDTVAASAKIYRSHIGLF